MQKNHRISWADEADAVARATAFDATSVGKPSYATVLGRVNVDHAAPLDTSRISCKGEFITVYVNPTFHQKRFQLCKFSLIARAVLATGE